MLYKIRMIWTTMKIYWLLFKANKKEILSGILFSILSYLLPQKYKWIYDRRQKCKGCTFNSKNKIMPSSPFRKDAYCTICECNIFLQSACPDCECAMSEMKKEDPSIQLKWEKHAK